MNCSRYLKGFLVVLLVLLSNGICSAQNPFFRKRPLPDSNIQVSKIIQDSTGFFWLGSQNGLYRYDGHALQKFNFPGDSVSRKVTSLYLSPDQKIWVGYENGSIGSISKNQLKQLHINGNKPAVAITAFQADKTGNIWIATYGDGLFYIRNNQMYAIGQEQGLSDLYCYALALTPKGEILAGTDGGIARCFNLSKAGFRVQMLTTQHGLPDNMVTALKTTPNGSVWVGTYSAGMGIFNFKTNSFLAVKQSDTSGRINDLHLSDGSVLAATASGQIIQVSENNFSEVNFFSPKNPANSYHSVTTDQLGNIWVADNSNSVTSINPNLLFYSFTTHPGQANIHAVLADSENEIWFSSSKGVYRLTQNIEAKLVFPVADDGASQVISMYQDENKNLWFGTFGKGLICFNPETGQHKSFTEKDGLINNNVLSIDGNHTEIWLGTLGGVSKFKIPASNQMPEFINFSREQQLGINYIYQVLADSQNRVWFATDGKGLTCYHDKRFFNYFQKNTLKSRTIYALAEGGQGTLWFGTPDQGLFQFKNNKLTRYKTEQNPKPVFSVAVTRCGDVLLLKKNRLEIFNPETTSSRVFGAESGWLPGEPDLNTSTTDKNGNVWIGTTFGLVKYISTSTLKVSKPKPVLTGMHVFQNPVQPESSHNLDHDANYLTFDFTGLWYQNPEEVLYQVKLDGYDPNWISTKNTSVTYPNLPPGKYNFRVRTNTENAFNQASVLSYNFRVHPPFWQTIPFYSVVFLLAGGSIFGYIKQRENKLKKEARSEEEKTRFQFETLKSQVNPHFLFNSFNTLIAIIEENPEDAVLYVEKLSDLFRNMLAYREKDLISLKEELELLENYFFLQQKRYGANLLIDIRVPERSFTKQVAPLSLQLLLENAIKHNIISANKPLQVSIFEKDEYLFVQNKLQLRRQPPVSTKIGLQNIKNRYRLLSKKDVIIRETEQDFTVSIPLINA